MSLVAGAAVGSIVSFLLLQGFKKVEAKTSGDGATTIFGEDQKGKPFKVSLANNAVKNAQFDIVELDAAAVLPSPGSPHYELKNAEGKDLRIFHIGFVPDSTFKTSGTISIKINRNNFFPITSPAAGMLKGVAQLNVPIPDSFGLQIKQTGKLEVFLGGSGKGVFSVLVGSIN